MEQPSTTVLAHHNTSHGTPQSDHDEPAAAPTSKPKDASRPKRKKARRACLACQRAHLTCGDERPCERCVKRGLSDSCHNGMRKKAKYLHDAPDDALTGEVVHEESPTKTKATLNRQDSSRDVDVSMVEDDVGSSTISATMPTFGRMNSSNSNMNTPYNSQMAQTPDLLQQNNQSLPQMPSTFDPNYFDDANMYFDTGNINFTNQYGALEFSMLGHISTQASANHTFMQPQQQYMFNQNGMNAGFLPLNGPVSSLHARPSVTDWQTNMQSNGMTMTSWNPNLDMNLQAGTSSEPHAFAIGAVSGADNFTTSPPPNIDYLLNYENQYTPVDVVMRDAVSSPTGFLRLTEAMSAPSTRPTHHNTSSKPRNDPPPPSSTAATTPALATRKLDLSKVPHFTTTPTSRKRDPASVYSKTMTAYPYTVAFHALTAVLQQRFSKPKLAQIAESLGAIRPSFISGTQTLVKEDLIFMEKCFQRQLLEYEDFINAMGTPTIICRRTGEIAKVGTEFTLMTKWREDVLLGNKPNLNANTGPSPTGTSTGTSSRPNGAATAASGAGTVTPRIPGDTAPKNSTPRQQPVFLAELLDDDSVIRFFEDFAKLAFADSKGSAWSPCKLLKYRTKEEMLKRGLEREKRKETARRMQTVEKEEDEKDYAECMYCWTVKRDVFDIPMMIVINFLPIV